MTCAVVLFLLGATATSAAAAPVSAQTPTPPDRAADAYHQYLLGQRLEDSDSEGAISAYKRAMTLDPRSADVAAELAGFYMRQNRVLEAMTTAEQALKLESSNRDAHRVLGTIYASSATADNARRPSNAQRESRDRAIEHLEQSIEKPVAEADLPAAGMLARLYSAGGAYDKSIDFLTEIIRREPGWQEGMLVLADAYQETGKNAQAIQLLEESAPNAPQFYPALADAYGRERRWRDSAVAYELAVRAAPRSFELKVRFASSLLNAGGLPSVTRAREVLKDALSLRANDERAFLLLARAERAAGDFDAAEATLRGFVGKNGKSARGLAALAETLEVRQRYQAVVDVVAPALSQFRSDTAGSASLALLLPHLGFAQQQLGQFDQAVTTFEEASKLAPNDTTLTAYLIEAHVTAKHYAQAAQLAATARSTQPNELRFAQLEAQALRKGGKAAQGLAALESFVERHKDNPAAYVALARENIDAGRGTQGIKVLQDAQTEFPDEVTIGFELGATFEKQKRFSEAEAVFRQMLSRDADSAPVLNYLGYMLADRGEKLDESVQLLTKALQIDPGNGSYLDSLGWAYFRQGNVPLAVDNLQRAAAQLPLNSVVQDHYGDILARVGRWEDAVAAWNQALVGDGDSIDRPAIEKKARAGRSKIQKK